MRAREVLRQRDFRLLFVAQTASMAGDAPAMLAITFVVLEIGGSPAALGAVLAARFVPLTALLLLGGVLADRFPRRGLMIASDLARAGFMDLRFSGAKAERELGVQFRDARRAWLDTLDAERARLQAAHRN